MVCKVTFAQKEEMEALERRAMWLKWYEDAVQTYQVWIQRLQASYHGDEDMAYPWVMTVYMLVKSP